ncbi:MAG: FMN-binding protein [Spirochaetales bacterium]|nr:FMN-binding protein [Spirochaetales bacterium]
MNPVVDRTLRLALICGVAALLLGLINSVTAPQIEAIKLATLQKALEELVVTGAAGEVETLENPLVAERYPIMDGGEVVGYILSLVGNGYGGEMKLLASYSLDGTLLKAILMDNNETPGLGKKAEKSDYMDKFLGKGAAGNPIPTSKGELEQPDAVGGSTITFTGVSRALAAGSAYIREEL